MSPITPECDLGLIAYRLIARMRPRFEWAAAAMARFCTTRKELSFRLSETTSIVVCTRERECLGYRGTLKTGPFPSPVKDVGFGWVNFGEKW